MTRNVGQSVSRVMEEQFDSLFLRDSEKDAIRKFLVFHVRNEEEHGQSKRNLKIISDDLEKANELGRKLLHALFELFKEIDCRFTGHVSKESELVNEIKTINRNKTGNAILITDCSAENPDDWEKIRDFYVDSRDIIKIVVFDRKTDQDRFRKDDHIYYRVFNDWLYLCDYSADDALKSCFDELKKKGFSLTDEFVSGMTDYVMTVYPKADLAKGEFVQDLVDRVLNLYYEETVDESGAAESGDNFSKLYGKHVPFYRKNLVEVYDAENEDGQVDGRVSLRNIPESEDISKEEEEGYDASKIVEDSEKESQSSTENVNSTESEKAEEPKVFENIVLTQANHDKKNIMILALSTASGKRSTFKYEDKFLDEDCQYQLEPVTKYMIESHKGESIIFIELCTSDVITPDEKGVIAKDYFESRIEEYNKSKGYNCKLIYQKIDIDLIQTDKGLVDALNELKEIKKKEEKNINHIWVDTHGGLRDVTFMLNSLISLLKIYDIIPDKIFGVRFDSSKEKIHEIVDQNESFRMMDFVSGMNEFIKYGSAELLSEYYKHQKTKTANVDSIVKAMCEVSDGTKLCDPASYISALNKLGSSMRTYKNMGVPFDIFVDYIKDDYGVLLDSSKRNNIDIIQRCYKKGMYQQALTFIESLMPAEFVDKHIVYFGGNVISVNRELNENARRQHQSYEQYIFEMFILGYLKNEVSNDNDALTIIKGGNYGNRRIDLFTSNKSITISTSITRKDNNPYVSRAILLKTDVIDSKLVDASELMFLHKAIKRVRNMTNHSSANNNRPTVGDISRALGRYVELAKGILG